MVSTLQSLVYIKIENNFKNRMNRKNFDSYNTIKRLIDFNKKIKLEKIYYRCHKCGKYTYEYHTRFYPKKIIKEYVSIDNPNLIIKSDKYASKWVKLCYKCNDQFDRKANVAKESLKNLKKNHINIDKYKIMYDKWKYFIR